VTHPALLKDMALALTLAATPALAEAPAALQPTRDVDITYKVPVPGTPDAAILQRLRWSAASSQQRVDLPTSGNWMVIDFPSHRMALVHDQSRQVIDLPAPPSADQQAEADRFARQGTAEIAGLPCTQWRTTDPSGQQTLACYTTDGVLLRASAGPRVLMEAIAVTYAPQDVTIFKVPASYTHKAGTGQ